MKLELNTKEPLLSCGTSFAIAEISAMNKTYVQFLQEPTSPYAFKELDECKIFMRQFTDNLGDFNVVVTVTKCIYGFAILKQEFEQLFSSGKIYVAAKSRLNERVKL